MFEKSTTFVKENREEVKAAALAGAGLFVVAAVAIYCYRAGVTVGAAEITANINQNLKAGTLVWGDGHNVTGSSEAAQTAAKTLRDLAAEHPSMWVDVFPTPYRKTIG